MNPPVEVMVICWARVVFCTTCCGASDRSCSETFKVTADDAALFGLTMKTLYAPVCGTIEASTVAVNVVAFT